MAYDAHGRLATQTDARSGASTFGYDALDRQVAMTTPDPDGGGPGAPQTTRWSFDPASRVAESTLPDGERQWTEFSPCGEVMAQYGARQYPVGYSYDAQGRMKTLTTWQDFASRGGAAVTTPNYEPTHGLLAPKLSSPSASRAKDRRWSAIATGKSDVPSRNQRRILGFWQRKSDTPR